MISPHSESPSPSCTPDSATVILPIYGRKDALHTVTYLHKHPPRGIRLFFVLVDNGNPPELAEALLAHLREGVGDCVILRLPQNRGGAGAFRAAMLSILKQHQRPNWVWLLDDDAELTEQTFPRLREDFLHLERKGVRVGAVGSVQLGKLQRDVITEAGGYLSPITGRYLRRHIGESLPDCDWYEEVGYLPATSLLMRMETLIDVGPFEQIFLHCDDIDWGYRARAKGWRLFVTSRSVVYHPEWASKPQTWIVYYDVRNLLWCLRRHLPFAASVAKGLLRVRQLLYWAHGRKSVVKLMTLGFHHAKTETLLMRDELPPFPSWCVLSDVLPPHATAIVMDVGHSSNVWATRLANHRLVFLSCGERSLSRVLQTLLRQVLAQIRLCCDKNCVVFVDCACTKQWPFPLLSRNKVFYWETTEGLCLFREYSAETNL